MTTKTSSVSVSVFLLSVVSSLWPTKTRTRQAELNWTKRDSSPAWEKWYRAALREWWRELLWIWIYPCVAERGNVSNVISFSVGEHGAAGQADSLPGEEEHSERQTENGSELPAQATFPCRRGTDSVTLNFIYITHIYHIHRQPQKNVQQPPATSGS